jgi:hypothetical protein
MSDSYRVVALGKVDAELKFAITKMPKAEALAALVVLGGVYRRLKSAPFDFGEELYDLKVFGVQVRLGVQLPIAIQFGADEKNRIVVVQSAVILRQ